MSAKLQMSHRRRWPSAFAKLGLLTLTALLFLNPPIARGNVAQYDQMAEQIRSASIGLVREDLTPRPVFDNVLHKVDWLGQMSERLAGRVKSFDARYQLINSIRYEAQRAGLDPQLVFAVIEVESNFNSQAVSSAGAIGLMQIMPFWAEVLGDGNSKRLFNPFLNIRYGCLILAHYLDIEKGNVSRALARYNGSLGRMTYPNKVFDKYRLNWRYAYPQAIAN